MLGYDIDPCVSRLTVNADEALQIRTIFKLYLDYNALLPVVREIDRRGWRTKQWVTRSGVTHGGTPFTKGRLFRLLRNPIYIGKIDFKKQIYEAEHEAIVESAIWEKVQQILQRNGRNGGAEVRDSYGTLLKGLLRCAACHAPMIRTYSTKDSRHYRHYTCAKAQRTGANCQTRSVSEPVIKAVVTRQIRKIGSDPRIVARALAKAVEQRRNSVTELILERQAAHKALASLGAELRDLVSLVACRDQTVTDRMADLQKRIVRTESRLTEILHEFGCLEDLGVDEADFRAALGQFGPVWESLNSREQVHIIRMLIEHIVYNGKTNKVTVSFRSAGIRRMCQGTGNEGANRAVSNRANEQCRI
jgi:site-specific DNA recombinase